jgi:curved DNA-binding protein CbpA
MAVNFYDVLGVSRTATDAEIRARFRELARDRHPDRVQGPEKAEAEKAFQLLTEALNVLVNPQRRRAHDFELEKGGKETTSDPAAVAKTFLALGAKAFKAGDLAGAVENFDMAVKHNPNDAKAHYYLATACAKVPRLRRQAIAAIERAIELDSMNPTLHRDAANLYRLAGLTAKAERALEQVLTWSPEDPEAIAALAEIRAGRKGTESGKGLLGGLFRKGES